MIRINIQVEVAIIGLIQAIAVTVIGGMFVRESRRHRRMLENVEKNNVARASENLLAMRLMDASMHLGVASATAIKEGKGNGNITNALDEAAKADENYHDFLRAYVAGGISKG